MLKVEESGGITFAIDDVAPATEALAVEPLHQALAAFLGRRHESCSDYHGDVVSEVYYQPLLAAVYKAYGEHRPLALSPDAIWITISQGVAHHVALHAETLRPQLVAHQGKLELALEVDDWVMGSPENPWAEAFEAWTDQIRDRVGADVHDALLCDFGTSGPLERAVSRIAMMDVFQRYFQYLVYFVCGIPTLTLKGTPDDWKRLRDKAEILRRFDMAWWLEHLAPILDQFVRASEGDVDLKHWQAMCKLREEYGGAVINGWIAKFFPYLRAFAKGPCTVRNPVFDGGEGMTTRGAPSGLSRVPFSRVDLTTGERQEMEVLGGLVGVRQDPQTLTLEPVLGWAVVEGDPFDATLAELDGHELRPGRSDLREELLPCDLAKFYWKTDGAALFVRDDLPALRIWPREDVETLEWNESESADHRERFGPDWLGIAMFSDRGLLAVNVRPDFRDRSKADRDLWIAPICYVPPNAEAPLESPVIATSFEEFLAKYLESGGEPYWLSPDFERLGVADDFTRKRRR